MRLSQRVPRHGPKFEQTFGRCGVFAVLWRKRDVGS